MGALGPMVGWCVTGPCRCGTRKRPVYYTGAGRQKEEGPWVSVSSQGLSSNTEFPLRSLRLLFYDFQMTAWAGHDPFSTGSFPGVVEILTM